MAGQAEAGSQGAEAGSVRRFATSCARLWVAVLLCLAAAAASRAGDLEIGLEFESAALGAPMKYSVYLPDAYGSETDRRFPVIYLLHGYGGNEREWIERGSVDAILDRMIGAGAIPPLIAVMPDGAKGWYVDSAGIGGPGDYETAIAHDLPAHVEAVYRAIPAREGRAIAGLSMGGYGALRLAFFHPDTYAATASLSGALFEKVGIPGVEKPAADALGEAERWFHGAYGRPFNEAIYMARNPFSAVAALARTASPPKILITTGDDDYFKFYEGSAQMFLALRRAGVAAEFRVADGGHEWSLWQAQFPEVLRFFADAFAAKP